MDVKADMLRVEDIFKGKRFLFSEEKHLQDSIEKRLILEGVYYKREHRLSPKDIIDFIALEGIGLEVKIKGSAREIYKQIIRYAEHDTIKAIIVVTNKSLSLPEEINEKKVRIINLGRAWL